MLTKRKHYVEYQRSSFNSNNPGSMHTTTEAYSLKSITRPICIKDLEVGYTNWTTLIEIDFQWSSSSKLLNKSNSIQIVEQSNCHVDDHIQAKPDFSLFCIFNEKVDNGDKLIERFMFLTGFPRIYWNYYLRFDNLTLQQAPTPV